MPSPEARDNSRNSSGWPVEHSVDEDPRTIPADRHGEPRRDEPGARRNGTTTTIERTMDPEIITPNATFSAMGDGEIAAVTRESEIH